MIQPSLSKTIGLAIALWGTAMLVHLCSAYRLHIAISASSIAKESLIIFGALGWIGFSELKRMQRHRQILIGRILLFSVLAPILFVRPTSAAAMNILLVAAMVMLFVFLLALYMRRIERRRETSNDQGRK